MTYRFKPVEVFNDPQFPLACKRDDADPNSAASTVFLHRHDFHELVVIMAGRGRHVMDGGECDIETGDVFLVHGEMAHGYADCRHLTLVDIFFCPRRLKLPLSDLREMPGYHVLFRLEPHLRHHERFRGCLRLTPQDLAKAGVMIAQLQEELAGRSPGYRFMACAHLLSLIRFLSRSYAQAKYPDAQPLMRCGEVLSCIERRFAERLTVRQLARIARMSERSLNRMFHRVTGQSPMNHVIRVRIARAQELLRRGDLRVTEATFQCGFNDSAYFSRQFRKVTGMTPREFRSRGMETQEP